MNQGRSRGRFQDVETGNASSIYAEGLMKAFNNVPNDVVLNQDGSIVKDKTLLLKELSTFGLDEKLRNLWKIKPPSITEFFQKWFPEPLFPVQHEFAVNVLGVDPLVWDDKYDEGHAFFGKGAGKDRTIAKMFVYIGAKLLCMHNPQDGLSKFVGEGTIGIDSPIDIVNVSKDKDQAKDVFFKNLKTIMRKVKNPYTGNLFFEERGVDLREGYDIQTSEIKMPFEITFHSLNSKQYAGEGLNLFFVAADEIGSCPAANIRAQLTSIRETLDSRFPRIGKLLLMSYKYGDNCPMTVEYKIGLKDKRIFSSCAPTWVVNPNKKKKSYARHYRRNPEKAQWTYECKETGDRGGGYIRQKYIVDWAFSGRLTTNPFAGNPITTTTLRGLKLSENFFRDLKGKNVAIHVDLAKGRKETGGDCAGIAIAYPKLMKPDMHPKAMHHLKKKGFLLSQEEMRKERKGVIVPLALQIFAEGNDEVQFNEIIEFIVMLRDRGVRIFKCSYDGWNCQPFKTLIKLLNGTDRKIGELVGKKNFWVYSYDREKEEIVPGKVKRVWEVGKAKVWRITFDNGESEEFTKKHPFLMRENKYKEVRHLKVGDSIMPLYTKINKDGYEEIKHPGKKWELTHQMVANKLYQIKKGNVIHHKDEIKLNNDPDNFKICKNKGEHLALHSCFEVSQKGGLIGGKIAGELSKSPERREHTRQQAIRQWADGTMNVVSEKNKISGKKLWTDPEYRKKQSEAHIGNKGYWTGKKRSLETIAKIIATKKGSKLSIECKTKISIALRGRKRSPEAIAKMVATKKAIKRDKELLTNNHKIIKIEYVGVKVVYDMEVEKYHNFGLSCGIFVHNSIGEVQRLLQKGINTEHLSVDKITDPYDTTKELMYTGLLTGYENSILVREFKELIKTEKGKVDHPEVSWKRLEDEGVDHGSKDVSDCVAGSTYTVMKEIPISSGIVW